VVPTDRPSIEIGAPLAADAAIGGDGTLGGILVELAARFGPRTALVTPAGRWTYAELRAGATAVAKGLLATGVAPGERVGVLMPNGFEWVAATFGAALLGAVPVPMSVLSSLPEQEAAFGLVGARVLLAAAEVGGRPLAGPLADAHPALAGAGAQPVDDGPFTLARLVCAGAAPAGVERWDDLLAAGSAVPDAAVDQARAAAGGAGEAIILFTSGTSGVPKAVVHGHLAPRLQPTVWARMQMIRPDERIFSSYPFCWSSGFARSLVACLSVGACLVTVDHFEPARVLALMEAEQVTMAVTPPAGHLDLRLAEHPDFALRDLSALVRPANPTLAEPLGVAQWRSTGYGLTETFTLVTASPADHSDHEPAGSAGKVLPGWTIKVTDPDTGQVVPRGTVGQFRVQGPALMRGYHGRPGSPFDESGFFVTPDVGSLDDDGFLWFSSRIDDIVRSAGVNVSTTELERELAADDRVRLAVVVGLPHPSLGQALVACIVKEDEALSADDVVAWLRPRVASYKIPRAVLFFADGDIAYTMSQKVQLADLRDQAARRVAEAGLW
jgi:acyl-CoA synthetase (AMP-forming)/AMP-acid ligase II